jgi:hypothetical protein
MRGDMIKYFDAGTLIVIIITFILFSIALFVKGLTHDLLLEAGVFLVSVKLIIMSYKNSKANNEISKDLSYIKSLLENKDKND